MRKALSHLIRAARHLKDEKVGDRPIVEIELAYVDICFAFYSIRVALGVEKAVALRDLKEEIEAWAPGHDHPSLTCPATTCTDCYPCLQKCLASLQSGADPTSCQDAYNQSVDQEC